MRIQTFGALAPLILAGCAGPYQVAKVAGRVTLDGKPLPKASVTFVPQATKGNLSPGPTAAGMTDADGRYELIVDRNTPGSVVGTCRIYITTSYSLDDRDGGPSVLPKDLVPERYNKRTELVFDVPAGGTDQANFDLKTR